MESRLVNVFRKNLKYFRTKKNLSQEKLSELLDKNANYINLIENGKSVPPLDMIEEIADILEINPVLLFDENGCVENILPNGKEDFAKNLSEVLSRKLKGSIYSEILKFL